MLCALTVRKLKPGSFEDFRKAFMGDMAENPPEGWVRFDMIRNVDDENEVICFGFYDGTLDDLRGQSGSEERAEQMREIDQYVESVGADGLYEVVEEFAAA